MAFEGYGAFPSTTPILASVPAVAVESKWPIPSASSQGSQNTFVPAIGVYQSPGETRDEADQPASGWKRYFSIASYIPYFNVDTDVVVDRITSSINSFSGDFFGNIETNPDMYGPVWISTTLVFMLAALGNCASYLVEKRNQPTTVWNFDVNYFNWAACIIYAYILFVPAAFYFVLQYFGVAHASLVRLWCMWGYSLFILLPTCLLMIIPVEFLQWVIIILAGSSSGSFIVTNLKAYTEGGDLMIVVLAAFLLQFALAMSIKICFFA